MTRPAAILVAALLTTWWPDGSVSRDPATSLTTCVLAAEQWMRGIGLPLGHAAPAVRARCQYVSPAAAGFQPGWDGI